MRKKLLIKIFFALFVFSSIIYVPLRSYKQNGNGAVFSYFAGDAFYYLNIAKQSVGKAFYTFDGTNATNGFHPLWQFSVAQIYKISSNENDFLRNIFFFNILILATAYLILFLALYKLFDDYLLSLISLIPGYLFLIFSFVIYPEHSPWSYLNGMETSLTILFFSVFLKIFLKFRRLGELMTGSLISISILLTLIGFSRLDDFLLLFAFSILFLSSDRKNRSLKKILTLFFIPAISLIIYLIYNLNSTGVLVPVSGVNKIGISLDNFVNLFSFVSIGFSYRNLFGLYLAVRVLPIVFILFIALMSDRKLHRSKRFHEEYEDKALLFNRRNLFSVLISYIYIKLLLNFLFVDLWHQGTWYFFLPLIIANILISVYLKDNFPGIKGRTIPSFAFVIGIMIIMNTFVFNKQFLQTNNENLFNHKDRINMEFAKISNGEKVLEMDDGIIAFCLNTSCLSGFGLAADIEAIRAKKSGTFLDLAYSRGYRILASVNYFNYPSTLPDVISDYRQFCRLPFFAFDKENLSKWNFSPILRDTEAEISFIRFSPKN